MAMVVVPGPVNPAQVKAAVNATACTVRARDSDNTVEVDVPGVGADTLRAALASITYDPKAGQPTDEVTVSRTRMRELHSKGWANLTAADKSEVSRLALALLAAG